MLKIEEYEGPIGLISVEGHNDSRGNFYNLSLPAGLQAHVNTYYSFNPHQRTLRGMHFQHPPFEETKIVLCLSGTIFDASVAIKPDKNGFRPKHEFVLGPKEKYQGVLIPTGFAHGFLTLEENSTLAYLVDKPYSKSSSQRLCWDDPKLQIAWPAKPLLMSESDASAAYIGVESIE